MVERLEIDALLVGALYGELSLAEDARLTAHLESHPQDRSALDGLKSARAAVHASRIFEVQMDPPQSLSALLLQEAARRAPRVVRREDHEEGWFTRFVRSFVAHPAMAAAATLVLVIGVAGTLYMANGPDRQLAEQTAHRDQTATRGGEAAPMSAPPAEPSPADQGVAAAGSGYAVALQDPNATVEAAKHEANKSKTADLARGGEGDVGALEQQQRAKGGKQVAQATAKPTSPPKPYVEVYTKKPMPKDLPDTPVPSKTEKADKLDDAIAATDDHPRMQPSAPSGGGGATGGVVGSMGPAHGMAPGRNSAAAPPPPPAATVAHTPKPTDAKPDVAKEQADPNAWARSEHERVKAFVRAGNCRDAASVAIGIKNRATDYFNSYVANDRAVKQCMQYINDAAEKDAERSAKSRPAKRLDANESMK